MQVTSQQELTLALHFVLQQNLEMSAREVAVLRACRKIIKCKILTHLPLEQCEEALLWGTYKESHLRQAP